MFQLAVQPEVPLIRCWSNFNRESKETQLLGFLCRKWRFWKKISTTKNKTVYCLLLWTKKDNLAPNPAVLGNSHVRPKLLSTPDPCSSSFYARHKPDAWISFSTPCNWKKEKNTYWLKAILLIEYSCIASTVELTPSARDLWRILRRVQPERPRLLRQL